VIDIRSRKMISEKPVEVKGLEWTLSGNRVEITEGGALIRFDRGVTMTLMASYCDEGQCCEHRYYPAIRRGIYCWTPPRTLAG
jgi:hypothetical protein